MMMIKEALTLSGVSELPATWEMKACVPFNNKGANPSYPKVVYLILFFPRRRAILLRRDYSVIQTMETRYARKLLSEAQEQGWVREHWKNYSGGGRPESYPEEAEIAYWIDVSS